MGVASVAVYSEADAGALHVGAGDEAISIGGAARGRELPGRATGCSRRRYRTGADAIHPGYGFLAENAEFAARCEAAGIAFIGPTRGADAAVRPQAHGARAGDQGRAAAAAGHRAAGERRRRRGAPPKRIGYPVMLKSTAGGGGIGMRRCADGKELAAAFDAVARLARAHFKQAGSLHREAGRSPRATSRCRSSATGAGGCWRWAQRDCSLQRRNQKVIEETPPPGLSARDARGAGRRGGAAGQRGELPVGRHRRVRRRSASAERSTSWR